MFVISDRWRRRATRSVTVRAHAGGACQRRGPALAQQAPAGLRAAGTGRVAPRAIGAGGACPVGRSRGPAPPIGVLVAWRAPDGPARLGQPSPVVWRTRRSSNPAAGRHLPSMHRHARRHLPTVMRGSELSTVRRKASDLLVAVALLHGADHLVGGYVEHDARVGGVVASVVSGLPSRRPGQRRELLRRVRIGASGRQLPPRTYRTTFTSLPGTTMTLRGSTPSIRAAIRASAIAAAFTSSRFAAAGTVTRARTLPFT
jgi:hypothetical protein